MRAAVLGCGSIGRRHARNLVACGIRPRLIDIDPGRSAVVAAELSLEAVDRDAAGPLDLVVVCTPSVMHVDDLAWALDRGAHVLVEKPLGVSQSDAARARALCATMPGRIVSVGCNLRFTQGFRRLRALLEDSGALLSLSVDCGWYLPAWRPEQDYREGYSARRALGGGVILDAIHEIDYTIVLAGPVQRIHSAWLSSGVLDIDVEDIAQISLRHAGGVLSQLHLDYLRRTYSRSCVALTEQATVRWDFAAGSVERCTEPGSEPEREHGLDLDRNQQYVDELMHFIRAIGGKHPVVNPVNEASATLEVALEALAAGRLSYGPA